MTVMAPQPVERFSIDDAALIVIDSQNDFCHPDGTAAQAGMSVAAVAPAARRLTELVTLARLTEVPVVFVRTNHDDEVDSPQWCHRLQPGIGPHYEPTPPNCRTGTWGAQFFAVHPEPGELVVTKHRYSAFHGTDLAALLRRMGRTSLLFTGFTTNVCVETSLRDGLSHDFLVSIVQDCCAAFDPEEHKAAVTSIGRYFGTVVTSCELATRWGQARSSP